MLKYLNTKAKPVVVFIFSLSSLVLFIISSLLATRICPKWSGIPIGIGMMIIAIPFHWGSKNKLWGYLVSFIINSLGSGFIVSAYYIESKTTPDIYSLFIGAIPTAAIIFLVYLMLHIFSIGKGVTITVAVIINIVLTIISTVLWIKYGNVIFSFGFYCSLIGLFYLCVFGITINHDERAVFRDISFGSFGSLMIIAVVVIFILSEGDVLDGLDFGGGGRNKKGKK